jgi:hypothetical protein
MVVQFKYKKTVSVCLVIFFVITFYLRDFCWSELEKSIGYRLQGIDETKHEISAKGELYNYQSVIYGYYKVGDLKRLINDLSVEIDNENTMHTPRIQSAPWWFYSFPKNNFTTYSNLHIKNRKYNLIFIKKESFIWLYKGPV